MVTLVSALPSTPLLHSSLMTLVSALPFPPSPQFPDDTGISTTLPLPLSSTVPYQHSQNVPRDCSSHFQLIRLRFTKKCIFWAREAASEDYLRPFVRLYVCTPPTILTGSRHV